MAEPVRALETIPSITLPVQFQEGHLWKPRYPSLIREDHALVSKFQFEPAFQVYSGNPDQQVEVVFEIATENVVFAPSGLPVRWQSLVPENPGPDVEVELVDGNPKVCRVRWTRTSPVTRLVALRIACEPLLGTPDQPPAADDDATALTQVEGGVYLAIIDRGVVLHRFPSPLLNPAPSTVLGERVRVVGIDARSRPVYDLFTATNLPEVLVPELAFRAAHGESLSLPIALDLPNHNIQFKVEENDQVAMEYVFPTVRPEELEETPATEDYRLCTLKWRVPPCITTCTQGKAASLNALLDPEPLDEPLKTAITWVRIDPTVIEPPPCDASGVCTNPRDQGD